MRLVGSAEEAREGWLGSDGRQLRFWRDTSVAGGFHLRSVVSKPQVHSPAYSTRTRKEPRWYRAVKSNRVSFSQGLPGRASWKLSHLKSQCTKFHFSASYLDSGTERTEWTRDTWGKSGFGGSGEITEGTTPRVPVLSHSQYCRSHLSQAEHSSPKGISLRGSNSPACLQELLCSAL